jgi:hypothetical protein
VFGIYCKIPGSNSRQVPANRDYYDANVPIYLQFINLRKLVVSGITHLVQIPLLKPNVSQKIYVSNNRHRSLHNLIQNFLNSSF